MTYELITLVFRQRWLRTTHQGRRWRPLFLYLVPKSDRKQSSVAFLSAFIAAVCLFAGPHVARAAGVVGTGTAASCTEMALNGALAGGGLVTFKCGASQVTITVTGTKTISATTTIDGGGLITISGGRSVGVFSVNAGGAAATPTPAATPVLVFSVNTGVTFTVQNLTIANGQGTGGSSGGIANNVGGTLTVTNSTLSGNGGGGIDNGGTLTVTNSTFSGNSTDPGYGGGGIANLASGTLTINNSTFSGNHSDGGGGIYNDGMLTVTNSTFSGNVATNGGGGIYNYAGTMRVSGSTFSGNSTVGYSSDGGAIVNGGTLTITNSTFSGNSVSAGDSGRGGGITNGGTLTITNSTFSGNTVSGFGGRGGGIANGGDLTVTNSTFSDNGAPDQFGQGGGIFNVGGTLSVTNSTFFDNGVGSGGSGGGISGSATLRNTILAHNGGNCAGGITDGGHNLDDGTSCGFTANGSLSNTDPKLAAGLANNGGPTQTIALQAGSPAINAGDESVCAAAPVNNVDQRGYIRPGIDATRCSIGAYEYNSPGPAPTPTHTASPTITPTRPTPTRTETPTVTPTRLTPTPTPTPTITPTRPAPTGTPTAASRFTEVEPNNSCGSPQNLGSPVLPIRIEGFKTQPFGDAVDFYAFSATPGTQLRVTLEGDSSKPTPLTAYGVGFFPADCPAAPSVSAFSTESPAQIEFAVAPDGISIIGITACCDLDFSGSGTIEGAYVVFVEPLELGTPTPTRSTVPTNTATPSSTASPSPSATPTLLACAGDCDGMGSVTVNEIITLVNITLGDKQPSACPHGIPTGAEVDITLIIQAVNWALGSCPLAPEQGCLASGGTVTSAMCCASTGDFPDTCEVGACGCSPDASHEVRACVCGTGTCFNGSACVSQ